MKKSDLKTEAELKEIAACKRRSRSLRKKVSAIREELINHWCCTFGTQSAKKQIITAMYRRLRWIDMETMKEFMEECFERTQGTPEHRQVMYMFGIMRNALADMGVDFARDSKVTI